VNVVDLDEDWKDSVNLNEKIEDLEKEFSELE